MQGRSLLLSFTLLSFLAFFITGIALVWFINEHTKMQKIEAIEDVLQLTLQCALKPELTTDDIKNGIDEVKIRDVDNKLNDLINNNTIMAIKIFNSENRMIYSLSNESLKGYLYDVEQFQEGAKREYDNKVISLLLYKETSNVKEKAKVLIANLPIVIDGSTVGTYKVYKSYDEVQIHTKEVVKKVSIIVFLGLIILYLLLIKIVYNSSKTLISQNNALFINKIHIQEAYDKLNSSYKDTVAALSNAIDTRDTYTAGHSKRVSEIALRIGSELDLKKEQLEILELSALFHDIGKLGVKDSILLKPDELTDEEFDIVMQHPAVGSKIVSDIDFLRKTQDFILYHHERVDGGGYPKGIRGEDIPIESRIIAVADSYDAMVSDIPYRKGMAHLEAVRELLKNQGTQFDSKVVQAFLKAYGEKTYMIPEGGKY